MVGRRRQDPVLAAEVRERLLRILAESGPRRVRMVDGATFRSDEADGRPAVDEPDEGFGALLNDSSDYVGAVDEGLSGLFGSEDESAAEKVAADREPSQDKKHKETPELDVLDTEVPASTSPFRDGRWPFGRRHLVVIAVLLMVGLAGAGWAVLRARSVALDTPVARPSQVATAAPTTAEPTPQMIMVHVLGAVRKPGVVELLDGSRVSDALQAAGGLKSKADPGELNLAQVLADGQQVVVGTEQKPSGEVRDGGGSSAGAGGSGSTGASSQVNLNRATQEQLEALPGVGPVTAQKIIAWRDEHERFSRIEELQEVAGIGPKTYADIAPHVTV